MKLTRKQLRSLINEAIEDPRSKLDLSRLSPEQLAKLEMVKDPDDMATYYMLLDAMLDAEGDTYLDTLGYAAQIIEQPPVSVDKDMFISALQELAKEHYGESKADYYVQLLYDVIGQDIEVSRTPADGLLIKGAAGLSAQNLNEILNVLDKLNPLKYQAYLNQRALLHMLISLANSTEVFFIFAEEEGIIHYVDKTTYALSSYFRSLYEAGKINVTGLDRNNRKIDPKIKA